MNVEKNEIKIMGKMHENEFEINEGIVRTLLKSQCPQWSDLSISPIKSSGTDNARHLIMGAVI